MCEVEWTQQYVICDGHIWLPVLVCISCGAFSILRLYLYPWDYSENITRGKGFYGEGGHPNFAICQRGYVIKFANVPMSAQIA